MVNAIAPADGPAEGLQALRLLTSRTGGNLELLRDRQSPKMSVAALQGLNEGEYILSFQPPSRRAGVHSLDLKATTETPIVLLGPGHYSVGDAGR